MTAFHALIPLLLAATATADVPPSPAAPPAAAPSAPANAAARASRTLVQTVELGAPPSEVFQCFKSAEGIKKLWSVAQASVDFRVGGQIRTRYSADGDLSEPTSIINTILAYEPDRMLAIKPTAPQGAPDWLQHICQNGWNVMRLDPIDGPAGPGTRTRLTLSGMGYGSGPLDDQAYAFFEKGNRWSLDKMQQVFPLGDDAAAAEPSPKVSTASPSTASGPARVIELDRFVAAGMVPDGVHKEAIIAAPREQVFAAWTNSEGIKSFLGVDSTIDLRIGGPMELYFGANKPEGQRGSEGAQILSYLPNRMLSFSWNAPPSYPEERAKHTWVVIQFHELPGDQTRVELDHVGFGASGVGKWDEVRTHFDRAWGNVLKALAAKLGEN